MEWILLEKASIGFYSLVLNPPLERELELQKIGEVISFLQAHFQLETETNMLEWGRPPYYRFKMKEGVQLTVALDDFEGLSIDSHDREFLKSLKTLLREKKILASPSSSQDE